MVPATMVRTMCADVGTPAALLEDWALAGEARMTEEDVHAPGGERQPWRIAALFVLPYFMLGIALARVKPGRRSAR